MKGSRTAKSQWQQMSGLLARTGLDRIYARIVISHCCWKTLHRLLLGVTGIGPGGQTSLRLISVIQTQQNYPLNLASLFRTILPKCIPGTVLVDIYSRYGRLVLSNHSSSLWYACYTGEPEKLIITFSRFP